MICETPIIRFAMQSRRLHKKLYSFWELTKVLGVEVASNLTSEVGILRSQCNPVLSQRSPSLLIEPCQVEHRYCHFPLPGRVSGRVLSICFPTQTSSRGGIDSLRIAVFGSETFRTHRLEKVERRSSSGTSLLLLNRAATAGYTAQYNAARIVRPLCASCGMQTYCRK